ncbi:unnamed protein product [Nyctereutes procyonoides]|uniref:(raccoon dog) hypothetical protein n=1 Tax=Nyctereutes procyonoides TaxID=34880 RepID=A0A811YDG4_NYCPR|nr:unnamed protein product [Nyctereutes procyonoides]
MPRLKLLARRNDPFRLRPGAGGRRPVAAARARVAFLPGRRDAASRVRASPRGSESEGEAPGRPPARPRPRGRSSPGAGPRPARAAPASRRSAPPP